MSIREDVSIIRERLECAKPGTTSDALEALARLEAELPIEPLEKGYYQYKASGLYYTDGKGKWFDVTQGYVRTYPTSAREEEFIHLVPKEK